jgi:hypothetical protein
MASRNMGPAGFIVSTALNLVIYFYGKPEELMQQDLFPKGGSQAG